MRHGHMADRITSVFFLRSHCYRDAENSKNREEGTHIAGEPPLQSHRMLAPSAVACEPLASLMPCGTLRYLWATLLSPENSPRLFTFWKDGELANYRKLRWTWVPRTSPFSPLAVFFQFTNQRPFMSYPETTKNDTNIRYDICNKFEIYPTWDSEFRYRCNCATMPKSWNWHCSMTF